MLEGLANIRHQTRTYESLTQQILEIDGVAIDTLGVIGSPDEATRPAEYKILVIFIPTG